MISEHQPTIFAKLPVVAASSSLKNGPMGLGPTADETRVTEVYHNRSRWLAEVGLSINQATLVRVTYGEGVSFARMQHVEASAKGKGMRAPDEAIVADALFTKSKYHGLFLPLADCGGIVLYDAKQQALGVVHLGRQSTFAGLAEKSIEYMQKTYDTNPADVYIWVSPSISGDSYWLHTFQFADDHDWQPFSRRHNDGWLVDLQGYNIAQFMQAGVTPDHIEYANIDTAKHGDYPSHYRYNTHGKADKAGRFAIVAYLTDETGKTSA